MRLSKFALASLAQLRGGKSIATRTTATATTTGLCKGKAKLIDSISPRNARHSSLNPTHSSLGLTQFRKLSTSCQRSNTASSTPPPNHSHSSPYPSYPTTTTTNLSPDILLRCTIFDSSGSATSTSGVFKKSRLCSDHGLEPRDLRKIDSRVPNLVPTILARRGGILVNILHIRAMIKKDKVLLFDSYGSTDSQLVGGFVYNLQHNLRHTSGLAYEFRALESILVSVLDALRIELGLVRGWTGRILQELDDDVDREKLRTLLQVSRKLNAFLSRAKAVKNAVTEVLENEEDMMLMYLSRPPPSPSSSSSSSSSSSDSPTQNPETPVIDELELLLESFDKQVEEVVSETTQLSSDISNTQEVVELILDNNRNKLLALDLKTSIATMGISAGTLWAGLFGMNLKSHMEEMDWAFVGVSGVAFAAVGITMGVGLRRLERLRRVGLGNGKRGRVEEKKKGWWGKLRTGGRGKEGVRKIEGGVGTTGGAMWNPGYGGYHPSQQYGHHSYPPPPSPYPYPYSNPHSNPIANGEGAAGGGGAPAWWPINPFSPSPTHSSSSSPTSPPSHTISQNASSRNDDIGGAESSSPSPSPISPSSATLTGKDSGVGGGLGLGLGSKWNPSSSSTMAKKRKGNIDGSN